MASKRGPGRPPGGAEPGLTREKIFECVIQIIDEEGVENAKVRKVAQRLGVVPNSLYSYVDNGEEMIQGALLMLLGQMAPPPVTSGPWIERLVQVAIQFRSQLLEHPNVVATSGFRETFPFGFFAFIYPVGEILADAGFNDDELVNLVHIIFYHIVGFILLEVARQSHGVETRSPEAIVGIVEGQTDAEIGARSRELMGDVMSVDFDRLFERSVRALLNGLESGRFA